MELTTSFFGTFVLLLLFMITKIQNLNGTHNRVKVINLLATVVYDYKDTKFEWNSQQCYIA